MLILEAAGSGGALGNVTLQPTSADGQVRNGNRGAHVTLLVVAKTEHTGDLPPPPNSQLCIFPGAGRMILFEDPPRFNGTVERFFCTPFGKGDGSRTS
ncbi:MAG: hypothetical protein M1541_18550 [Acidobacteria bacterium]|nr:hypothetical protein [Acidobacteriota bacterium]